MNEDSFEFAGARCAR